MFLIGLLTVILLSAGSVSAAQKLSFNRDIRPILASKCYDCHGPDENARKAGRRLDTRDGALKDNDGVRAIVPGKPELSEVVRRMTTIDPDDLMPPPKSKKTATSAQIETVRQWIAQGAEYETHWAFIKPVRPILPQVKDSKWPRNEVDYFILKRLEKAGLHPSEPADRYTLIKRVYLDLIGLLPTPEEADVFAADKSPDAYEKVVDRLLKSKHYGERWARRWLDLARYSDTNGYEKDRDRSIWPYRDWVINALNAGMPFDQFTIEQLAGDMLPNATVAQRVATGFHRNTMINEEGGIDPLEFRFYAMVDRVNTTGTTWLGLTVGCAQCHTHKFDPIRHTEYYQLMAYLDNADEPELAISSREQSRERTRMEAEIGRLKRSLSNRFPFPNKIRFDAKAEATAEVRSLRAEWVEKRFDQWFETERKQAVRWTLLEPTRATSTLPRLSILGDGSVLASGDQTKRDVYSITAKNSVTRVTGLRLEVLPHESLPSNGPGFAYYEGPKGDFFLSELTVNADGQPVKLARASHTYAKNAIGSGKVGADLTIDGKGETGWSTHQGQGKRHVAVYHFDPPLTDAEQIHFEMLFERHYPAGLGRFRFSVTDAKSELKARAIPDDVEQLLLKAKSEWSWDERQSVFALFLETVPDLESARKEITDLVKKVPKLPTTLVLQERPADHPRVTHRHHRGEFTQPKESVRVGVPELFNELNPPTNRSEFARWLVNGENPLTARVVMNRHWEAFFGRGIVRTAEDFGTQSAPPTHPDLLDWLATEFVRSKWSLKTMHRLMVLSATYRQDSRISPELLKRDPRNELIARGPRFRIDAELVRDVALSAAGLLSKKMGGPSVFPPQPASVTDLAYGGFKWKVSEGEDRYRRSLYTFSKRTAPFAAYMTFDGTSGEACLARRERSNTPLQALTVLNDQVFVEAATSLAGNALKHGDGDRRRTAAFILRRCLIRLPAGEEVATVIGFQERQMERISSGELSAEKILGRKGSANEAAWAMTARAVLNLDETITKE